MIVRNVIYTRIYPTHRHTFYNFNITNSFKQTHYKHSTKSSTFWFSIISSKIRVSSPLKEAHKNHGPNVHIVLTIYDERSVWLIVCYSRQKACMTNFLSVKYIENCYHFKI